MHFSRIGPYVFTALVLASPFFATSQTAEELQNRIETHNAQIETLNKEIETFEKQLRAVGAQKQTLQSAVNTLDLSVKQTQTKIKAIQTQIATTELEIQKLGGHIEDKEESIALDNSAIAESIRTLHEAEGTSFAETMFSDQPLSALWEEAEALFTFQESIQSHIASLAEAKEILTVDKNAEEKKREELMSQRANLRSEEQSLAVQKKEQQNLLATTKSQESTYQALLKQKQNEKATFEAALFELASQLEYVLDPSKIPPIGKGVLRWPLDNVFITQEFGRTSASGRLYSSGTHDGIDLRASIGTPVKASLAGTVMEVNHGAAPNCQYGKWVLVKHGNGLATLYAHLSDIRVGKGATVGTGGIIGYSGNTGYATGPHLHFTVYLADAVSFKQYKCKSGTTVTVPIAPLNGYLDPVGYL